MAATFSEGERLTPRVNVWYAMSMNKATYNEQTNSVKVVANTATVNLFRIREGRRQHSDKAHRVYMRTLTALLNDMSVK